MTITSSKQSEGTSGALRTLYSNKEVTIVRGVITDDTAEERKNVSKIIRSDNLHTGWHVLR